MIVSHENKFIFIKTRKTAGTSIEIGLSKYCGRRDVISPIGKDEAIRESLGFPGPQNTILPINQYRKWDLWNFVKGGGFAHHFNHTPALGSGQLDFSQTNLLRNSLQIFLQTFEFDKLVYQNLSFGHEDTRIC